MYGLTYPLNSQNPLQIVWHEWQRLFTDFFTVKTWRERLRVIFGTPV
jgi:hypothetical protein